MCNSPNQHRDKKQIQGSVQRSSYDLRYVSEKKRIDGERGKILYVH